MDSIDLIKRMIRNAKPSERHLTVCFIYAGIGQAEQTYQITKQEADRQAEAVREVLKEIYGE